MKNEISNEALVLAQDLDREHYSPKNAPAAL
jgi:hypothetical protein